MNLALKDIRFNLTRFLLTTAGIGFLIAATSGMIGLYRGIIADAMVLVDEIGADLWVVQGERAGPFAEGSSIPGSMDRRVEGVPGVKAARRFAQSSQQFRLADRAFRATVTGLDYPEDRGDWLKLRQGRHLASRHDEAIADVSIGLAVGDVVRLGLDGYQIVGLTEGMVDSLGDGLLFVTLDDALSIAKRRSSEEVQLARAANVFAHSGGKGGGSAGQESKIAAVLVTLEPGARPASVTAAIQSWGDASVLSQTDQRDLLLNHRLWKLRVQILAFTLVLMVVMAILIAVILYTMTLEKLHPIAMLKLIGAPNPMIVSLILQQAIFIGTCGFTVGAGLTQLIFPHFPRRILILTADQLSLFAAVLAISGLASLVGISRALRVRAQEVLS